MKLMLGGLYDSDSGWVLEGISLFNQSRDVSLCIVNGSIFSFIPFWTLMRMDVVPDKELWDFINNLGEADVQEEVKLSSQSTPAATAAAAAAAAPEEAAVADVWQTIADAVDDWTHRILDAESLHDRSESFRSVIGNSIRRLELDGFLLPFELNELHNIADKWVRLLHILSTYAIGDHHTSVKKDIISLMLDLYDLKQLNAQTLIHCCASL